MLEVVTVFDVSVVVLNRKYFCPAPIVVCLFVCLFVAAAAAAVVALSVCTLHPAIPNDKEMHSRRRFGWLVTASSKIPDASRNGTGGHCG